MFSAVMTSSGAPVQRMTPGSCIRMTRSENIEAMFRLWLFISTIMPLLLAIPCRRAVTKTWCLRSRFDVGSSRISMSVSWTRPLAMATF